MGCGTQFVAIKKLLQFGTHRAETGGQHDYERLAMNPGGNWLSGRWQSSVRPYKVPRYSPSLIPSVALGGQAICDCLFQGELLGPLNYSSRLGERSPLI